MVNKNVPHCACLSIGNYINRVSYKVAYTCTINSFTTSCDKQTSRQHFWLPDFCLTLMHSDAMPQLIFSIMPQWIPLIQLASLKQLLAMHIHTNSLAHYSIALYCNAHKPNILSQTLSQGHMRWEKVSCRSQACTFALLEANTIIRTRCHAVAGRTARCRYKFRHNGIVHAVTLVQHGFLV